MTLPIHPTCHTPAIALSLATTTEYWKQKSSPGILRCQAHKFTVTRTECGTGFGDLNNFLQSSEHPHGVILAQAAVSGMNEEASDRHSMMLPPRNSPIVFLTDWRHSCRKFMQCRTWSDLMINPEAIRNDLHLPPGSLSREPALSPFLTSSIIRLFGRNMSCAATATFVTLDNQKSSPPVPRGSKGL